MSANSLEARFARAELLYQQSRHELAAHELRQILAVAPENPPAHALLALCLVEQKQFDEAQREAEVAVGQGPDFAFAHYARARVLEDRHDYDGAAAAIGEAIRLEPADADFHAQHAQIRFNRHEWALALAAAETGLQFDPEHVAANNLRAMALVKLGRKAEAGQTIDATLARSPENSFTHANRGWTLLESGDRKQALAHFQESLRLDPTNDWARAGVVEALKAGNPIYGLMLRYFLWMQKLTPTTQVALIFGVFLISKVVGSVGASHPELRPWITPVQVAYFVFVLLSWLAVPLMNLMLFVHPLGRHALLDEQRPPAIAVGVTLLPAIAATALWFISGFNDHPLGIALDFCLLAIVVSAVWRCRTGWPRWTMAGLAIAVAILALNASGIHFLLIRQERLFPPPVFTALWRLYLEFFTPLVVASQLIANVLQLSRPRR